MDAKNLLLIEREDELKLKILDGKFAIKDIDEYIKRFSSRLKKRGINAGISVRQKNFIETDYYDTKNYDLKSSSLVYRIRKLDNNYIANIKEDLFGNSVIQNRMEYTVSLPGEAVDAAAVSYFKGTRIWKKLKEIAGRKKLYKKFSTIFTRYNFDIVIDRGCSILLSIDDGEITAGGNTEKIFEIEMELKSGSSDQMLLVAAVLSEVIPLDFEPKSKFLRGLILSGAEDIQSEAVSDFNDNDVLSFVVKEVLNTALFVSENLAKEYLTDPSDPESLHKLRVSLRKIRTLVFYLKPILPKYKYMSVTGILRKTAGKMSLIREIDVFLAAINNAALEDNVLLKNEYNEAVNITTGYRRALEQKLEQFISSGKLTTIFLNLHAFLLSIEFSQEKFLEYTDSRIKDLKSKAESLLREPELTRDKYHKLRVYFKRIRYISEFFLINDKKDKTSFYLFSKKAQDVLGELNDAYVNMDLAKELLSGQHILNYTGELFEGMISKASNDYLLLKEEYKEIFDETKQEL